MLKVFSYGGGVQSTAALALAALKQIEYQTFLFCNVGDDSEHPGTLKYVREVAIPYAQVHGITLIEIQKTRFGESDTLYQHLIRTNRSIPIPMRMSGNGAPGRRSCTSDFKIGVVDKWLREHGAKETGAIVGLGISRDEFDRAGDNKDPDTLKWKTNSFPLLYDVPRSLDRQDCINVIRQAGLPVPPKSSCYFCPYHRLSVWQEMRKSEPELFWKSVELEEMINERRATLGLYPVWFTRKLKPLSQATTELEQGNLFEDDGTCDSGGYCFA